MKRIIVRVFDNFEEWIGAVLFSVMFIVLVLQIIFRQIINQPLIWSEQLSMMIFVYIALIGVSSCIKNDEHVGLDLVEGKVSKRTAIIFEVIKYLATFIVLVFFMTIGVSLTERKYEIEVVALGISSSYIYGALPLITILMFVRFFQNIWKKYNKFNNNKSVGKE